MCILLAACGTSPAGQQGAAQSNAPVEGILEVKGACAVVYIPGAGKMNELQQSFGKDFKELSAANAAALQQARQYLRQQGMKILETSQYQLHFVKSNGTTLDINLNRPKYAWEIFLFDGKNDPIKANLTDIEAGYQEMKNGIIQ
ncbi:hypothetical protein CK934_03250 [Chitinophaga sp. MD30]|nr:hypothetical protein CK934_03250 [Chitinophaga sp. MD30]